jgi:hypothetical protein
MLHSNVAEFSSLEVYNGEYFLYIKKKNYFFLNTPIVFKAKFIIINNLNFELMHGAADMLAKDVHYKIMIIAYILPSNRYR